LILNWPLLGQYQAILSDVDTMETRAGEVRTCLIDSTWRQLETHIPSHIYHPTTKEKLRVWIEHIRFAQWMNMVDVGDRWAAFCAATQLHEDVCRNEKVRQLCGVI